MLVRDDGAASLARDWLDANREDLGLPPYHLADDALVRHIDRAVGSVSNYLSERDHTNRVTREAFNGVVYLAEDTSASTVKPYSMCARGMHVVVIGISWVHRLVEICDRLAVPLAQRPRSGPSRETVPVTQDADLTALLSGDREPDGSRAVRIAEAWPSPALVYTEDDLGCWAVFYDLIRLVWFHELAHALCGHISFVRDELALMALYESPADGQRQSPPTVEGPASQVLQCLEMHADEFAVRSSLGEILYGHDPAGMMVHTRLDLGDRLLHLNTAFGVFALLWELDEQRARGTALPWSDRTHPPVALRFDRFRNFQREMSMQYDLQLVTAVDVLTMNSLEVLTQASPAFAALYALTPMMVRTPSMDEVERYERELMRLEPVIAQHLEVQGFVPAEFLET